MRGAGPVAELVERCAVPIDRLEVGLRRRHPHEVGAHVVIGLVAADPEVDAGGPDQGLGPGQDEVLRRRGRDGETFGQVLALIEVEQREAFQERDGHRLAALPARAFALVLGSEPIGIDDGRAPLAPPDIAAEA